MLFALWLGRLGYALLLPALEQRCPCQRCGEPACASFLLCVVQSEVASFGFQGTSGSTVTEQNSQILLLQEAEAMQEKTDEVLVFAYEIIHRCQVV